MVVKNNRLIHSKCLNRDRRDCSTHLVVHTQMLAVFFLILFFSYSIILVSRAVIFLVQNKNGIIVLYFIQIHSFITYFF